MMPRRWASAYQPSPSMVILVIVILVILCAGGLFSLAMWLGRWMLLPAGIAVAWWALRRHLK